MDMHTRAAFLTLATAGVLALAACGGTVPEAEPPPPHSRRRQSRPRPPPTIPATTTRPTPTSSIVDLTTGGGFVPVEVSIDGRPDFRLYGDGTVLARPENETFPSPPQLVRYRLTPDGHPGRPRRSRGRGPARRGAGLRPTDGHRPAHDDPHDRRRRDLGVSQRLRARASMTPPASPRHSERRVSASPASPTTSASFRRAHRSARGTARPVRARGGRRVRLRA